MMINLYAERDIMQLDEDGAVLSCNWGENQ